ncbi:MAG: L-proline dehydrogenase [uncultured archaeon A07HB70]|nr:MAG: L-proline dehydrogenase [uncultured archaeon A07HB70]
MIPPVAARFVAGETPAEAMDHARRRNSDGVGVVLHRLGERNDDRRDADDDTAAYVRLCRDLADSGLRARVSVTPTQLGLAASETAFRENYRRVAAAAAEADTQLWCDTEDATTADATLSAAVDLAAEFPDRLGVRLRANLRRTPADAERLAAVPVAVRLVEGAYDEAPAVAHQGRAAVDAASRGLIDQLVEQETRLAVGSHDPAIVEYGLDRARTAGVDVEVQLPMGVREDAQRALEADGVEVWQHAPFGREWAAYLYRRVRERLFAARAAVGG